MGLLYFYLKIYTCLDCVLETYFTVDLLCLFLLYKDKYILFFLQFALYFLERILLRALIKNKN